MMLVERAAEKPNILKLISVAVQRARPAITGNRDKFTQKPVDQTYNMQLMDHEFKCMAWHLLHSCRKLIAYTTYCHGGWRSFEILSSLALTKPV